MKKSISNANSNYFMRHLVPANIAEARVTYKDQLSNLKKNMTSEFAKSPRSMPARFGEPDHTTRPSLTSSRKLVAIQVSRINYH